MIVTRFFLKSGLRMSDPYKVIGVSRDASDAEIKKAYRGLAKKYHPDSNKDDKSAQAKFSEATAAYDILSDKEKRGQFDRGEIDGDGNPKFQGFNPFGDGRRHRASGGFPGGGQEGGFSSGAFRPEDIFSELFGGAQGAPSGPRPAKGEDVSYKLQVTFRDAMSGATKRVSLANAKTLDVRIPKGVQDGQQIRLKGQGKPGVQGGPAGDGIVTVNIGTDPVFRRDGNTLLVDLPITLYEAVLGAKVKVPTLDGFVDLSVPANSSSGKTLRLKNKGVPGSDDASAGDMLVSLKIILPDWEDPRLNDLMDRWRQDTPYDVRGPKFGNN